MSRSLRLFLMFSFSISASAQQEISVPQKFLDAELLKPAPAESRFSAGLVSSGQFANLKKAEWKACRWTRVAPSTFARAQDPLELFLESEPVLKTLSEIEEKNLLKSELEQTPWSGDYWSYSGGILASRFLDLNFTALYEWIARYEYVKNNPAPKLIEQSGQEAVQILSPAEKYDLLTGQSSFAFTNSQWEQGKEYYDEDGKVENWMGICHGWASAAIMEPRPVQAVDIPSLDRKWNLHFNPSEVKGLLSYSWATNSYPVVTLGDRCNQKNPKRDEHGRILDPECFDLNPATWHLAVVHKIGLSEKSFVLDATYDYEVWNQPVIGYDYKYFHPQTQKQCFQLKDCLVPKEKFHKDLYKKYRSPQTSDIVGIEMKVGYVVESFASNSEVDNGEEDEMRWVVYTYDLELDKKGQIIGGEWHSSYHPDFIWTPKLETRPLSPMDRKLLPAEWKKGEPLPEVWSAAARAGAPRGLILNAITEEIAKRSVPVP